MERNGMKIGAAIELCGYTKKYENFELGPLALEIPQGFVTALIGENGAGKSTLLNAIGGITSSGGKIKWLGKYNDIDEENLREELAWCAPNRFFPGTWTIKNVRKSLNLAFESFNLEDFDRICAEFNLENEISSKTAKKIMNYSDGNRARLALAATLARKTKLLVLDEPDSPLDPAARDQLASKLRAYLNNSDGSSSVLFSTHNIADMDRVVDYAVFLCNGKIVLKGFVEDLREEYRYVHGSAQLCDQIKDVLQFYFKNDERFEGLISAADVSKIDGRLADEVAVEVPTLQQISIVILRSNE